MFGIDTERIYHATAHAKGSQDALLGGMFKSIVAGLVYRENQLLNTPELIAEWMKVNNSSGINKIWYNLKIDG